MIINGKKVNLMSSPVTLKTLLEDNEYDIKKVAVEKNGNIVPKSKFDEELIYDEDTIEVVSFVGGG